MPKAENDRTNTVAAAGDKREAILDAATAVFARKGFQRSRTREIAQEAGVAEGTIFNYFSTKRDLLFAIIERLVAESVPALVASVETQDAPTAVRALILNRLEFLHRNRELVLAIAPELFSDAELREAFERQVLMPTGRWLFPMMLRLLGRHGIKTINPRVAIPAFMGGVLSSYMANHYTDLPLGDPLSHEEIADQLTRLYTKGLLQIELPDSNE